MKEKSGWTTERDSFTYQLSDDHSTATLLSPLVLIHSYIACSSLHEALFLILYKALGRKPSVPRSLEWCALYSTVLSPLSEIPTSGNQINLT